MAKKILAVVLAVMMAVSAMAVSVFADQTIALKQYKGNVRNNTYDGTGIQTYTIEFSVPIFPDYGYTDVDHHIVIDLPTDWGGNGEDTVDGKIDWKVTALGQDWAMKSSTKAPTNWGDPNKNALDTQEIHFGYMAHDCIVDADGNVVNWTTIPQDVLYGATSYITITGTVQRYADYQSNAEDSWRTGTIVGALGNQKIYGLTVKAQTYRNGVALPNSVSYAYSWAVTAGAGYADKAGSVVFVNSPYTYNGILNGTPDLYVTFGYDHTLKNRNLIAAAGDNDIELVIELTKPLVGFASYNLWAVNDLLYSNSSVLGQYWGYNGANRTWVATKELNGELSELRFDVPKAKLIDLNSYGYENIEFAVTQNILLNDQNIFSNGKYTTIDRAKTGSAAGNWGTFSWGAQYGGTGDSVVYNGKAVVYAAEYVEVADEVKKDANGNVILLEETKTNKTDRYGNIGTVAFDGSRYQDADIITITVPNLGADERIATQPLGPNMSSWPMGPGSDTAGETTFTTTVGAFKASNTAITIDTLQVAAAGAAEGTERTFTVVIARPAANYAQTYHWELKKDNGDVMATNAYLNIKEEEAEPEDVTPPTQGSTGDEDPEDMGVEDTTPAPAPDNNPHTGIALAVVPMLVAAAAAVVSKKH